MNKADYKKYRRLLELYYGLGDNFAELSWEVVNLRAEIKLCGRELVKCILIVIPLTALLITAEIKWLIPLLNKLSGL